VRRGENGWVLLGREVMTSQDGGVRTHRFRSWALLGGLTSLIHEQAAIEHLRSELVIRQSNPSYQPDLTLVNSSLFPGSGHDDVFPLGKHDARRGSRCGSLGRKAPPYGSNTVRKNIPELALVPIK